MTKLENSISINNKIISSDLLRVTANRSELEIILLMLEDCTHGASKSSMVFTARQSYIIGDKYIKYLLDKKLISNGHKINSRNKILDGYIITDKGNRVKENLMKLAEILE